MKVSELAEILQSYPDNLEVVLSIDPEGNGFKKLDGHSGYLWDGYDIYDPEQEVAPCNAEEAVVLWPG